MSKYSPTRITDLSQLPDRVVVELEDWWRRCLPIKNAMEILKAHGLTAYPTQIPRWCEKMFPEAGRGDIVDERELKALPDEHKALILLMRKILLLARGIDITSKNAVTKIVALCSAIQKVATTRLSLARSLQLEDQAKRTYERLLRKAQGDIEAEVRKNMAGQPELLEQVLTLVDESTVKLETAESATGVAIN